MTIKNLMLLGAGLGVAALLRDKGRRDKLIGQARSMFDNARERLETAKNTVTSDKPANGTREPAFGETARTYTPPSSRGSF